MQNTRACGHPLNFSLSYRIFISQAVPVGDLSAIDIGYRFYAPVRMHREPGCIVIRICTVKRIKHQYRIVFLRGPAGQNSDQVHPCTVLCPKSVGLLLDFSFHWTILLNHYLRGI
ncbi:hypothetical protein SDC9_166556 [bioreactor metagenome]|uniref:Uncharacterized protein n=1 Tax=bioreactor metagenome TaxID=1076179 RepID=A0A645FZW9_9ZZZZ